MAMNPERLRQIEELYHSASELTPDRREAFLKAACAEDAELLRDVLALLAQDPEAGPMGRPVLQVAAGLLSDSPARQWNPGTQVGPYQIVSRLGEGGMGEVYRAKDTRLGRSVALKFIKAQFGRHWEREARAVAALNHPHIATLYEVGEQEGVPYLAMELVDGRPLKGPLPVKQAIEYGIQMADALAAAHAAGIVHRDLKPGNILVTEKGSVKVLDFGLAKMAEQEGAPASTQTAGLAGTPGYLAPEQIEGQPADRRSDIFAFGCILYGLLSGRRAFPGETITAALTAAATTEPKPLEGVPERLDELVRRCLRKDPARRFQYMDDVKVELEELKEASDSGRVPGGSTPEPRRPRRLWVAAIAAAVLACAGAVIGWIHWTEKPQPAPLVRFTVDPPPGEKSFAGSWPSVSPDGERILFGVGAPPRLWMYRLSTGESAPFHNVPWRPVSWYAHKIAPWSPDSNAIAVFEGDAVGRVDLTGGHSEVLRESVSEFAWGPSGSYFLGIPDKGLFWVERGLPRRQVTVQKPGEGIHEWPQLLPDGKSFLFEKRTSSTEETWLARLDGKEPKQLLTKASQTWYAPPDYLLYWDSGSIFAQLFDTGRGMLIGDARTLVSGVAAFPHAPFGMFSVSRNGVLAFRQGPVTNPSRLTWFDRSGNVIGTLGEVADYSNPALSPDGRRLAVSIRDPNGKRNIWVFDLARGTKTRLNFEPADESSPTWSPDGSEIAYFSDRHGRRDIYAKSSSGTGQERVLLESGDDKSVLDWSSDGKFLFYNVRKAQPDRELWVLPLTSSQRVPALFSGAPYLQDQAAVAPDSRSVIYRSRENGNVQDLYLQPWPPSGQRWQITTSGGEGPQWRGDGRELFYYSRGAIMTADVSAQGSPGPPRQLFPVRARTIGRNWFVVTRDGQRFLVITPEEPRDPDLTPFVVILNWQRLLEDR
jgi:serine/threonine protein kinase